MSDRGEEQERLAERVDYAHRQQAIDPFYEEAKEEVGWDQCQGRLTCDDASGLEFLTCLELRQRRHHPARVVHATRFPLSRVAGVALCQRCNGRWRGNCATESRCGGSR